ncbi:hypothetical protein J6590_009602 [Homalodisca vitripennis]|nr:hypothetical protein J6590_009602 [Homalodisca vitripennis]
MTQLVKASILPNINTNGMICWTGLANVTLVEASKATRDLHTRHGMHLNRTGKLWLVSKICEAAKEKADSPSPPSEEPSNSEQPATVDNTPGSPQQSAVPGSTAGNLPMAVQHLMT